MPSDFPSTNGGSHHKNASEMVKSCKPEYTGMAGVVKSATESGDNRFGALGSFSESLTTAAGRIDFKPGAKQMSFDLARRSHVRQTCDIRRVLALKLSTCKA